MWPFDRKKPWAFAPSWQPDAQPYPDCDQCHGRGYKVIDWEGPSGGKWGCGWCISRLREEWNERKGT